jgi:hypothetical protein
MTTLTNDGFLDGERLGLPVVGETLGWKVGSGTGEVLGPCYLRTKQQCVKSNLQYSSNHLSYPSTPQHTMR